MAFPPLLIAAVEIEEEISSYVKTAIVDCFGSDALENVQINRLKGGFSAASIRLDFGDISFVLRVINDSETPLRVNTELYSMKNAADAGIAPAIRWISPDGRAILMDYITGGTLTIEKGKNPEVIAKVAELLRKVHALSKNPFNAPSFEEHMEKFYMKNSQSDQPIWEAAISIIREGALELKSLGSPSVNTHGDLNPRNILISSQALYFIDWSEGTFSEPFHDLGYFSALMDYTPEDDARVLQSYLLREPTPTEKKRFLIAKKMNLGRLGLGGQFIGNKLNFNQEPIAPQLIEEWSYYAKAFANDNCSRSSQFFWNLAMAAIKSANAIDATSWYYSPFGKKISL